VNRLFLYEAKFSGKVTVGNEEEIVKPLGNFLGSKDFFAMPEEARIALANDAKAELSSLWEQLQSQRDGLAAEGERIKPAKRHKL